MGYRPGRGKMNGVYVLKTGIENEIRKDKGKAYVLFAHMKLLLTMTKCWMTMMYYN